LKEVNFEVFYTEVINYFQHNIYIAIAVTGVLLLLLFRKPKLFFMLLLIVAICISSLYAISYTSSLGAIQKKNMINKNNLL